MARYSVVHLDINGKNLIGVDNLRNVERNALSTRNVIYIYRGTNTQKIYTIPCAGIEWNHPTLKKNIE